MRTLIPALVMLTHIAAAQDKIMDLKPTELVRLDLSNAGAINFEKDRSLFDVVARKMNEGAKVEDLSAEEQRVWNETDETVESYWDVIGGGCSWYCGGGPIEVVASSELKSQGTNSYSAASVHDLSYKTAWVEGVDGLGVGQTLVYKFAPDSPRVTDIIIVNGYAKSETAYLDNGRAKKIKMYLNDKPLALLNLQDVRSKQIFKFDPIGNGNRTNLQALKAQPEWTIKFEILDVYKGLKYEDVAITEIFFDGIDVH